ncbi:MAG TPA: hypothetical protein VEK74_05340 [Burkholderiaceae bacterium]|nr:hypothetical protein [Burkholderiaceae bacterium]
MLIAAALSERASAQSFLDQLKQQAQKTVEQAVQKQQTPAAPPRGQGSPSSPQAAPASASPASSSAPGATVAAPASAEPWSPDAAATAPGKSGAASALPSSGPPDFARLPDIGGTVRPGLAHEEMKEAMLKMHPGFKVVPGIPFGTFLPLNRDNRTPPFWGLRGNFGPADGKHEDTMLAYYTLPPAKQQTYAVSRTYNYPPPGIERLKLIAALREKYGPEAKHVYYDTAHQSDDNIVQMYWLFDERGHPAASDNGASGPSGAPFNCQSEYGVNAFSDTVNRYVAGSLASPGICDTLVVVLVNLGASPDDRKLVTKTLVEIADNALLRRDALIVGDAQKAGARKEQQQQIDQSKQAKPTL